MKPQELKLIEKDISWSSVLDNWYEGEKDYPEWQRLFKERGFSSWRDWREAHVAPIIPDKLTWTRYKINDPLTSIPDFWGGPHGTWVREFYGGPMILRFSDIVRLPKISKQLTNPASKIFNISQDFPKQTTLIGLKQQDKIIIIEGMHRCCAITHLALQESHFSANIDIYLADYQGELPLMGTSPNYFPT